MSHTPVPNGVKRIDKPLARPGDPLATPDGQVHEYHGQVNHKRSIQEQIDPAAYRPMHQRSIKELPGNVGVMNGVSVVFMYTMMGVGDREIADALHVTVEQVRDIRSHSAYADCFEAVLSEFINTNSELLNSRIAAYSHSALDTMGELVTNAKFEGTRLRAAADLLDRAGATPKQVEQRRGSAALQGLRIVVVDGEKSVNVNVEINE